MDLVASSEIIGLTVSNFRLYSAVNKCSKICDPNKPLAPVKKTDLVSILRGLIQGLRVFGEFKNLRFT